jgi:hypothetical protein
VNRDVHVNGFGPVTESPLEAGPTFLTAGSPVAPIAAAAEPAAPPPTPAQTPGVAAPAAAPSNIRGPVVAAKVLTVADDFVVDIFLNGQRLNDAARRLIAENFGATAEEVTVEMRAGDSLVFNVVNNRLRWNGVCYFGVAGVADDGAIAFVSEETDSWSVCEDPGLAPRFIVERGFLADRAVQTITNRWSGGDRQMNRQVPRWTGQPIWGSPTNRNIWLKFNVPKG